jgi:hypothetical protein
MLSLSLWGECIFNLGRDAYPGEHAPSLARRTSSLIQAPPGLASSSASDQDVG